MRTHHQTSYQTLPRSGTNHRSRSQNHYYIQANEFQKRYQNSLMNAYRLNTSRKCPPCCGAEEERGYEDSSKLREFEKENVYNNSRGGYEMDSEYYETSYFNNQKSGRNLGSENEQLIRNLQKSKQYLQELIQKSNSNFRVHKQKTQQQLSTLQKLLQSKTQQIQQLTKQINRLKKISLQTSPSGINMSYLKQDQGNMIEMQNKEKQLKELQRKVARYREENSYFREDVEIKNKEIQQLKAKFKLKESNDLNAKRQVEKDNQQMKQEIRVLIEKTMWFQRLTQDKERQLQRQRQSKQRQKQKNKRLQTQLQSTRLNYLQSKALYQNIQSHYTIQYTSLQTQIKSAKQLSKQKDTQIQRLISKINCIQAELDFFKDKFTNLLMEIEREERQSAIMYDHAATLKEEGVRFYETTERLRQSELIELDSQPKTSRLYGFNMLEAGGDRLVESMRINNRVGLGKDVGLQSMSPKNFNSREFGLMAESNVDFVHRFPSLNMSISPIRTKD